MTIEAANSGSVISNLVGTIKQAAQSAGASFEYLLSTAKVESGLNAGAQAPTSSARGLFQFVEQTWLGTMKEAGPSLGYGQYAEAISRAPSGIYTVSDPAARAQILDLRNDPAVSTAIAGAFTQRNAADMTAQIGRMPTDGELYIAHFLGSGGATRMVQLAQTRPDASAADAFPYAAAANRSIFYDRQGEPRTVAQVYNGLIGRYQTARNVTGPVRAQAQPQVQAQAGNAIPDAESFIAAFAGQGAQVAPPAAMGDSGPAFHGLFRTPGQRGAVAPVVAALWSAPEPVRSGGTGPVRTLDLFRDSGAGRI